MSTQRPQPVLLSEAYGWDSWPHDPSGIKQMCDYGAEQFVAGKTDLLAIDCMTVEREQIAAYMRDRHPNVRYVFGEGRTILKLAIKEWKEEQ